MPIYQKHKRTKLYAPEKRKGFVLLLILSSLTLFFCYCPSYHRLSYWSETQNVKVSIRELSSQKTQTTFQVKCPALSIVKSYTIPTEQFQKIKKRKTLFASILKIQYSKQFLKTSQKFEYQNVQEVRWIAFQPCFTRDEIPKYLSQAISLFQKNQGEWTEEPLDGVIVRVEE